MSLYDVLTELAACLCVQIEVDGSPPTCFCGVVPGEQVTADYMGHCTEKNGVAWVRLGSGYPAVTPGQIDEDAVSCGTFLGVDIEVGILRNIPAGLRGEPPTTEQKAAATEQQIKDMLTIRRAIKCCSSLSSKSYVIGTYIPVGPAGLVVGGAWSLSVTV